MYRVKRIRVPDVRECVTGQHREGMDGRRPKIDKSASRYHARQLTLRRESGEGACTHRSGEVALAWPAPAELDLDVRGRQLKTLCVGVGAHKGLEMYDMRGEAAGHIWSVHMGEAFCDV